MGVQSAVLYFNEGTAGVKRVMKNLNLDIGVKTAMFSLHKDRARLTNMAKKETLKSKNRRRKLRSIRKGWEDQDEQLEGGKSYMTGNS